MVSIEGATAVVTGGQRGLGSAMADALLARGASKVYATSRFPRPSGDRRVHRVEMDVTDYPSVTRIAAMAREASIVINNAGTLGGKSLLLSDFEEIRAVFEVNYYGALRVARAFAPVLKRNGGGALVDVHSVLSWLPGSAAYGDSKAALWSATNSLRIALEGQRTLVVGVHMGYTDTDMVRHIKMPKNDPIAVATQVIEAISAGRTEVLADAFTQDVKASLSGSPEDVWRTATERLERLRAAGN